MSNSSTFPKTPRKERAEQRNPSIILFKSLRLLHGIAAPLALAVTLLSAKVALSQNVQALLEQARAKEKAGDFVAAERDYREALALAPDDPEGLKRFGILLQTTMKFDDSIRLFQRVLAQDPQYLEVNFFLGVSYFGSNNLGDAIRSFERELTLSNPHPRCRYYMALALQSSGRSDEAVSQLNLAVAQNPRDADALYQLARLHKSASLEAIEKLKALDEDSFQLHALMGEIYADEERYSDAIQQYQAALSKRRDAQGIHYAIGVAYWTQKQMAAAEKEFLASLKENPNDSLTNLYLGDIAVYGRRYAEALPYLRAAEKQQSSMSHLHLLLGKCYQGQNEPQRAKAEFLAAIEADPKAAQPHYLLAQVYRQLHDSDASAAELAAFEKLSQLEKDKDSPALHPSRE